LPVTCLRALEKVEDALKWESSEKYVAGNRLTPFIGEYHRAVNTQLKLPSAKEIA
jgi:hypothetical protein